MIEIGDIKAYDVQEIAKMFDMTPQSIRRFIREGRMKGRKVGTRWYVTEEAIRDYLMGVDNEKGHK